MKFKVGRVVNAAPTVFIKAEDELIPVEIKCIKSLRDRRLFVIKDKLEKTRLAVMGTFNEQKILFCIDVEN